MEASQQARARSDRARANTEEGGRRTAKDHGPSVTDDEQYEALRDQGASEEKAARIANTSRKQSGKRGGQSGSYDDWSKDDLEQRAAEIGIEGRSKMDKGELIDALRHH